MANVRGRTQDSGRAFEEFVPSHDWTEDENSHCLLVDLPGSKKEWLSIQVNDDSHISVRGQLEIENKIFHFEQSFEIPEIVDIEKIGGRYEDGMLYVIIPKLVKEEKREAQNATTENSTKEKHEHEHEQEKQDEKHEHDERHEHEHDHEEHRDGGPISRQGQNDDRKKVVGAVGFVEGARETWRPEGGLLGSVMEILRNNKGIVATAVIALSVGVLLSQKFQSNVNS